jgi:hypothetical protein
MAGAPPLLPLVSRADALAADFHATLARSFPAVAHLRGAASEEAAEPALGALRDTLAALQSTVDALVELVYHVDAWTAEARGHSVGQDPQQALKHVGGLVDVSAAQHRPRKGSRRARADVPDRAAGQARGARRPHVRGDRARRVCRALAELPRGERRTRSATGGLAHAHTQIEEGKKQTMDELADLLAAFG